jgi:hypothetical protein
MLTRTQLVITQTTWCQNGLMLVSVKSLIRMVRELAMAVSRGELTSSVPSDPGWTTSIVLRVSMIDEHRTSLGSGNALVYSRVGAFVLVCIYPEFISDFLDACGERGQLLGISHTSSRRSYHTVIFYLDHITLSTI